MLSGSLPSGWDRGSGGGSSQTDFPNTEYGCKINIYSALLIKLFIFQLETLNFCAQTGCRLFFNSILLTTRYCRLFS